MADVKPSERKSARQRAQERGDVAPPGTPGTGENVCPVCKGTGRVKSDECPECGGTGKVIAGVGGG